jgi:glycosyltransferase involved in cell wall biosynthesis
VLTVNTAKARFERTGEPPPSDVEVIRSPEWDLQRLLVLASGAFNKMCDVLGTPRRPSPFYQWCLPDPQIAWLTTVRGMRAGRHCSCIYASCSPFSSALSACLIKKATGKPVVLDFRDAWALNPHANYGDRQRRILGRLEEWVVEMCDALILNTPGAEQSYRRRYPQHAEKMTHIPNGFDRLNVPDRLAPSSKLTIMHVGDFYRSRNPSRLLQALANIGNRDIEFVQVGPMFDAYERFKDRVSIRIIDRVAHAEALRLMQTASVLYLAQGWESGVTDYIAVASKTYEYLATGLPVLADCPPGDNADVVSNYASRAWVLTSTDVGEVEAAVREAYASRHAHPPEVSAAFVETFNRERLASMLAGVLEKAIAGAQPAAHLGWQTSR